MADTRLPLHGTIESAGDGVVIRIGEYSFGLFMRQCSYAPTNGVPVRNNAVDEYDNVAVVHDPDGHVARLIEEHHRNLVALAMPFDDTRGLV